MSAEVEKAIGYYHPSVQELILVDDLLSALVGVEGRYVSIKTVHSKVDAFDFRVHISMDLTLQEQAKRIFPLCESFLLINHFVESRLQFNSGIVNHAFASALRAFLVEYYALIAQLEHQFRLRRLSIQGLWFYCQPMMSPLQALSSITKHASANNIAGSGVLDLLQHQAKAMAGDNVVRSLLEKMAQCASSAYLGILERWIYEGVVDDPYGEFFILENPSVLKDFDVRYSLKDGVPGFLASVAETILSTGKYLNVMRECGHNVHVPLSENSKKLTASGSNHHYLQCIKTAFDFASFELLNLINKKYDLMVKLRSIKHYLLLDMGDYLVHFLDIAHDELMKVVDDVCLEKLQSLLDLALRSTAAIVDPCHEDVICCLEKSSLVAKNEPVHQVIRAIKTRGTGISRSSLLCRSMLKFINSLLHYLTFEVLEHNWHIMREKLQKAKSVDEVIQWHDLFLDKCLRECLLLLPELLIKVENLTDICLQYAAAAQRLLTSVLDDPKSTDVSQSAYSFAESKQLIPGVPSQEERTAGAGLSAIHLILNFESQFNTELQSVGRVLSSKAQAEPYLTHLGQWILGVGNSQRTEFI